MRFVLDMSKIKSIDLEKQNKLLLSKTNDILLEWKSDNIKLIDVLKEKEKIIQTLESEIAAKKNRILALEDRLISISILEKKIRTMHENYEKNTKNLVFSYETKIKEASDPYRISPNLLRFSHENDEKIEKYEISNSELRKEVSKTSIILREKEKDLNKKIEKMRVDAENRVEEIGKLKEKIAEFNKEAYSKNNSRFLFDFLVKTKSFWKID